MGAHTKDLTSGSFDTVTQKGNVVIDFWAEWCVDPTTTWILTGDNSAKLAKDIFAKDILQTFDGKSIAPDEVERSFYSNKLGHCKHVVTETGREIKVTDEHQFLTHTGWKAASDLKNGEFVAIMPIYPPQEDIIVDKEKVIISDNDIINASSESMRVDEYLHELREKSLLPLKNTTKSMRVISRIAGMLFSDGNLYEGKKNNYRELSFSLGTENDVKEIVRDLKEIGFTPTQIKKDSKLVAVNKREYTITVYKVKVCSIALWLLFKALGVPVGSKVSSKYEVPDWIINSPREIKREFIAAYLGGDGPKILLSLNSRKGKEPYNSVKINDIEFHKDENLSDNGVNYAMQISEIIEEFGVKLGEISVEKDSYLKKNGKVSAIIHIPFVNNFENAFVLYQNIGYRYAHTKEIESRYAAEFLRRIISKKKEHYKKYEESIRLNNEMGHGYRKISKALGIPPHTAWLWIKKGVKPTVAKHFLKYPEWLQQNRENLPEGLVWEKVSQVNEISLEFVQKITMENNHNFIANGFLAHNCGPCKIMEPYFDAAARELAGKVVFGKVDVDSEFELAERFGIMSIPTILFFKDGEMVDRISGALPKEELLKKVKDVFK